MRSIEERITKILIDDFKVRHANIGPDTTFNDLAIDSLVIVELVLVLAKEFAIPLHDGELTDTMTIREAAEVLVAKGALP